MSKTLGDICAEAFTNCHPMQDRWQAAAEAVVAQYMKELTGCDEFQMGTFQIDNSKERAVIEAVGGLVDAWDKAKGGDITLIGDAQTRVYEAYKALDSEEG